MKRPHLTRPLLAGVIAAASLLSACASAPVALGTHGLTAPPAGTSRPIRAEVCGFQLLLFIPIGVNDRLERAYASLKMQAGGDVITDVEVNESWTYGFVGTSYCTALQAKAVKPN